MIDNVSDIIAMYNNDVEKEHIRLDRHQLEHDLTWCYLNKYLPSEGSILEIGVATGRYTLELAKRGYTITAIDFSDKLLEKCKQLVTNDGLLKQVQFVLADARDLGKVAKKNFDAVLLMGPLYHLVEEEDRLTSLKQVFNHLREGGIIVSSFISRFGIFGDIIKYIPEWIKQQSEVQSIIGSGRDPKDIPKGGFRGYFATVSEIAPLHEKVGFTTLVVAGIEPGISAEDESYNKLEGKQRELWLELFYEVSTEETIIGASRHLLYIGKKPKH
jgi:SAM-dependent methyltransferase